MPTSSSQDTCPASHHALAGAGTPLPVHPVSLPQASLALKSSLTTASTQRSVPPPDALVSPTHPGHPVLLRRQLAGNKLQDHIVGPLKTSFVVFCNSSPARSGTGKALSTCGRLHSATHHQVLPNDLHFNLQSCFFSSLRHGLLCMNHSGTLPKEGCLTHSIRGGGLVAQSCLTLCDPMDYSPPGSSVHGFPRQEYWSGLPFLPPGDVPDPGMEPRSPALPGGFFTT